MSRKVSCQNEYIYCNDIYPQFIFSLLLIAFTNQIISLFFTRVIILFLIFHPCDRYGFFKQLNSRSWKNWARNITFVNKRNISHSTADNRQSRFTVLRKPGEQRTHKKVLFLSFNFSYSLPEMNHESKWLSFRTK